MIPAMIPVMIRHRLLRQKIAHPRSSLPCTLPGCAGIILQLALLGRKHGVRVEWSDVFRAVRGSKPQTSELAEQLSICGVLMCRTSLVMLVYSSATSLVARSGVSALSAAHQIAFQLWLASSLLADSLAVAAQSLMAKSHGETTQSQRDACDIASLCLRYAVVLGTIMTALMHFGMPKIVPGFTSNPDVQKALSTVEVYVVFSQIVSSVAFVLDGIVYSFGAPGFRHATISMLYSAAISIATMWSASRWFLLDPLPAAWIGLVALMITRAGTMSTYLWGRRPV